MAQIEIKVPDIGDFKEVEIIEVLVSPGDLLSVEQSLITVESDKASMEIPSSHAGKLVSLSVKVGDKVSEGSVLGVIDADAQEGAEEMGAESVKFRALATNGRSPPPNQGRCSPGIRSFPSSTPSSARTPATISARHSGMIARGEGRGIPSSRNAGVKAVARGKTSAP